MFVKKLQIILLRFCCITYVQTFLRISEKINFSTKCDIKTILKNYRKFLIKYEEFEKNFGNFTALWGFVPELENLTRCFLQFWPTYGKNFRKLWENLWKLWKNRDILLNFRKFRKFKYRGCSSVDSFKNNT